MIDTQSQQQGSAIIWILIAVALFAALNFTFMGSNRSSTSIMTDQEASARAQQIIAYGNDIKVSIKKMRLRGCNETQISFENDIISGYGNPNAPDDERCHVFSTNGAGITLNNDLSINGQSFFGDIAFEGIGSSSSELSLQIIGIDQAVCLQINQQLNIADSNDDDFVEDINPAPTPFTGSYANSVSDNIGNDITSFDGQSRYCWQDSSGEFHYSQALIES